MIGKQRQNATAGITAAHEQWCRLFEELRDWATKFSWTLPALFDDLFQWKINTCGTIHHDRCGMPRDIGTKSLK
jgi:hypothetical protein